MKAEQLNTLLTREFNLRKNDQIKFQEQKYASSIIKPQTPLQSGSSLNIAHPYGDFQNI